MVQRDQSILKEISPGYSLEELMLKLKLQYFGHLMQRADLFENTLMLEKIEGRRRRGWDGWVASSTQWTWVWVDSGSWWWTRRPGMLQFMGSQRVGHDWATELNWDNHNFFFPWLCVCWGIWKFLPILFSYFIQIMRIIVKYTLVHKLEDIKPRTWLNYGQKKKKYHLSKRRQ